MLQFWTCDVSLIRRSWFWVVTLWRPVLGLSATELVTANLWHKRTIAEWWQLKCIATTRVERPTWIIPNAWFLSAMLRRPISNYGSSTTKPGIFNILSKIMSNGIKIQNYKKMLKVRFCTCEHVSSSDTCSQVQNLTFKYSARSHALVNVALKLTWSVVI